MKLSNVITATLFLAATALPAARLAHAADKKAEKAPAAEKAAKGAEVTLKGNMVCAKCSLHETDKCQNVLKVTEGGKDVKYYLAENAVAKDNHGQACGGSTPATVKGKVTDEAGKKILTASEIKYQ